nr:hypothetical protein [Tanacetum cinerariifolium]
MKLQETLDEEAILEEQMLALMHRFAERFTDRRVETNNLMVLHDHPLIDYVIHILCRVDGSDLVENCEGYTYPVFVVIGSDGYAYPGMCEVLPYFSAPAGRPFSFWVSGQTYELTNIIVDVFEYHFQAIRVVRDLGFGTSPEVVRG